MKIYKKHINKLFAIIFIVLMVSCDNRTTERGHSYLPDMQESQAYDTYSENPVFKDSMTLQKPVEGAIPRGIMPYHLVKTGEDLKLAGKEFTSPLELSKPNLEKGKMQYERFCMPCHGEKGDGKGFLYTSGKYAFPPGNLLQEKTVNRPDGQIFHIINVGINIMGSHASQISQEDRWRIVMYIREDLQDKATE